MKYLRPRSIFQKCEELGLAKSPFVTFLPPSDIGSIRSIEAAILVSLLRLLDARRIFEFGTFKGYTTSLFALNSNSEAKIFSIDLPGEKSVEREALLDDTQILRNSTVNDNYLIYSQFKSGEVYCNQLDDDLKRKIFFLKDDSRCFDFRELVNEVGDFDLIFIDGGHDFETAQSDSINALKLVSNKGVILWHDYNSGLHSDVSKVVKTQSLEHEIVEVRGTSLALYGPTFLREIPLECDDVTDISNQS